MQKEVVILLAEDDDGHAGLILYTLRGVGFNSDILCFESGEGILDFLFKRGIGPYRKDNTLYILLLDICMPGINGIEVLRQIKGDKWVNKIPVIMLSAVYNPIQKKQCMELGCDSFFVKVPELEKFTQTIEDIGLHIKTEIIPNRFNIIDNT